MSKRRFALALLASSVVLLLAAAPAKAPPREGWTVCVYMMADNDLEESALADLEEMAASGAGAGFDLLVLADRGSKYTTGGAAGLPGWSGTRLLAAESGRLRQLADWGSVDMGAPETLARFVAEVSTLRPARRRALLFWDHGGAWEGYGVDESAGESCLTLPELERGLRDGLERAGIPKLDLVGFDACLMASYEAMTRLQGFASYFLASEELEPGHGWDYRSLAAASKAGATPKELGAALIGGFLRQAEAEKDRDQVTLSLVDLSRLGRLDAALESFAAAARGRMAQAAAGLGRGAGKALAFGRAGRPERDSHMVDVGSLADAAAKEEPTLARAAAALKAALAEVVVAAESGSLVSGSSGISIYFPNRRKLFDDRYGAAAPACWRDFLASYFQESAAASASVAPRFVAEDNLGEASIGAEGISLFGRLAPGSAAGVVGATIYYGVAEGDAVVYLGDEDAEVDLGSGEVEGLWDGTALVLRQGRRETYGYLSLSAREDGALLYSIPFAYFVDGRVSGEDYDYAYLDMVVDGEGGILSTSLYKETDEGLTAELRPARGSKLVPLVEVSGEEGECEMEMTVDWGFDARDWESIELDYEELEPGTPIYLELEIWDAADEGDYLYFEGELP